MSCSTFAVPSVRGDRDYCFVCMRKAELAAVLYDESPVEEVTCSDLFGSLRVYIRAQGAR